MNNNQIQNPKVEVPKGMSLNDKDYANKLLSCLKEMVKSYTIAMTEASNETLFQVYKKTFNNYLALQRETYEVMFRKGWYSLEQAENQKITQKAQMLTQELTDLTTEN